MAEISYPVSTHNSGAVTEAEYERLASRFSDDGLYNNPFDTAPITSGAGLEVLGQPDFYGSVRGFLWGSGASEVPIPINNNDLTAGARQDRIVLRLDRSTWLVRLAVREGTPGGPLPALVRDQWDTGVYEVPIGRVTIPVGATQLTASNVVSEPLYVGSRIRPWLGDGHDSNPQVGQLEYTGAGYDSYDGSSWKTVVEDTGWVTLAKNGPNANAWIVNDTFQYRRINNVVHLRFSATRWSESGLALSDADGSTPYILPAGFRPNRTVIGYGNHSRSALLLFILTSGDVRIIPLNADLPAGRRVYAAAEFPI